jgi:hypothetical protein
MGIGAIIAGGVGMATYEVFTINARSTSDMTAIKEVENGVHWITQDALMAQTVDASGTQGFPLKMYWIGWDGTTENVTYTQQSGILRRTVWINGATTSQLSVARHISPSSGNTSASFSGGVLNVKLTSAIGGFRPATETRSFQVIPRSSQ